MSLVALIIRFEFIYLIYVLKIMTNTVPAGYVQQNLAGLSARAALDLIWGLKFWQHSALRNCRLKMRLRYSAQK